MHVNVSYTEFSFFHFNSTKWNRRRNSTNKTRTKEIWMQTLRQFRTNVPTQLRKTGYATNIGRATELSGGGKGRCKWIIPIRRRCITLGNSLTVRTLK
ncbi:uncharacterized protein LOC115768118 isoform X3 [Drosophila novamexicana]|uniref:uncharacterized protein LOC115768118 isoform X3 n=1 Tax=Drosophila novamexicana TaxID=47314 RepID=UPI0011E5DC66|nr:uncharacterized protein LOC115768118 isoform X3 [Drosophila novamexicana]